LKGRGHYEIAVFASITTAGKKKEVGTHPTDGVLVQFNQAFCAPSVNYRVVVGTPKPNNTCFAQGSSFLSTAVGNGYGHVSLQVQRPALTVGEKKKLTLLFKGRAAGQFFFNGGAGGGEFNVVQWPKAKTRRAKKVKKFYARDSLTHGEKGAPVPECRRKSRNQARTQTIPGEKKRAKHWHPVCQCDNALKGGTTPARPRKGRGNPAARSRRGKAVNHYLNPGEIVAGILPNIKEN